MGDYIAIALILAVVGAASLYIIRAKKKGRKCIGCPYADKCGKCSCGKEHNFRVER